MKNQQPRAKNKTIKNALCSMFQLRRLRGASRLHRYFKHRIHVQVMFKLNWIKKMLYKNGEKQNVIKLRDRIKKV